MHFQLIILKQISIILFKDDSLFETFRIKVDPIYTTLSRDIKKKKNMG